MNKKVLLAVELTFGKHKAVSHILIAATQARGFLLNARDIPHLRV